MALPKVNTIEYFVNLPVSGKEVKYRPFSVGEQKVLLQALEDQNNRTISHTIIRLVNECSSFEDGSSVEGLGNADLEFLFLQVRIKSVGEVATVVLGCRNQPQCDGTTPVEINLEEVEIEGELKDNKLMLTDTVGVTLRVPNYNDIQEALGEDLSGDLGVQDIFKVISYSIESIFDDTEVHNRGDFTEKEINSFIDELSTSQFNMLMEWFSGLPKMVKDVEYNCSKCGTECKVKLEGIQNFFV